MAHPHLKEARDGAESKLRRLSGAHGTVNNPTGNDTPEVIGGGLATLPFGKRYTGVPEGPQQAVGLKTKKNLGKFARGGRTKKSGKGTNVNIMIHPGAAPQAAMPAGAPALPMPRPAVPPPMPPAGIPGAAGPPPGLPPGAMPPRPGMPPAMMGMRKSGGRTFKRGGRAYDAGAGSGPGREEKEKAYGRKAHVKPKAI